MKRTNLISMVLLLISFLFIPAQQLCAAHTPNLSVNVNQAVNVVTNKMTEDLIQQLYEGSENKLKNYTYFQEIIRPYSSYVASDTQFTTKGLELYKKLQKDLEGKTPEQRKQYFTDSFAANVKGYVKGMAYDAIFDKGSQNIISTFQGMLSEAGAKIAHITKAKDALAEAESSAEYTAILKEYGLTGKWVDGFEEIEGNVNLIKNSKLGGNLADAYQAYSIISKGMQSSNPGHKIEALFELGATFGGKVPILGDFIKLYFEVAQAYLEACKGLAKSLRKFDQNCVGEGTHAQIEGIGTDERNVAFSKQFPGSALYCRGAGGIYLDIYEPVTAQGAEESRLYFWVNGKWVEGKETNGGISSVKHMVRWLRNNKHTAKATDIAYLAREYNKGRGFDNFVKVVKEKVQSLYVEFKRVHSMIAYCDDQAVETLMMEKGQLKQLVPFLGDLDYAWESIQYFSSDFKNDIVNKYIHHRLIEVKNTFRIKDIIDALSKIHPSSISGRVLNEYDNPVSNAFVEVNPRNSLLFKEDKCSSLETGALGYFRFIIDLGSSTSTTLTLKAKKDKETTEPKTVSIKQDSYNSDIILRFNPEDKEESSSSDESTGKDGTPPPEPPKPPVVDTNTTTTPVKDENTTVIPPVVDTNTTTPPPKDKNTTEPLDTNTSTVPPLVDNNTTEPLGCTSNQDCAENEVCSDNTCILLETEGCTSNQDCATDEICSNQICILPDIEGCVSNQDCATDEICSDGMCIAVEPEIEGCISNQDCAADEACSNGTCIIIPKPSDCESDHDCPLDKVCGLSGVCIASLDDGYDDSGWGDKEDQRQEEVDDRYDQDSYDQWDKDDDRYGSDDLMQDNAEALSGLNNGRRHRDDGHGGHDEEDDDERNTTIPEEKQPPIKEPKEPSKPVKPTGGSKDIKKPKVDKMYYVVKEASSYLLRTANCSSVEYSVVGPFNANEINNEISKRQSAAKKRVGIKRYPLYTRITISKGAASEKKPTLPKSTKSCRSCPSGQHIGLDPGKRQCHGN